MIESLLDQPGKLTAYAMNEFEDGSIGIANEEGFWHIPAGVSISEIDKYKLDNPPQDRIDQYNARQEFNKEIAKDLLSKE